MLDSGAENVQLTVDVSGRGRQFEDRRHEDARRGLLWSKHAYQISALFVKSWRQNLLLLAIVARIVSDAAAAALEGVAEEHCGTSMPQRLYVSSASAPPRACRARGECEVFSQDWCQFCAGGGGLGFECPTRRSFSRRARHDAPPPSASSACAGRSRCSAFPPASHPFRFRDPPPRNMPSILNVPVPAAACFGLQHRPYSRTAPANDAPPAAEGR